MELLILEESQATFKWNDVTIFYRTRVTAGDKYTIDVSGSKINDNKIEYSPWDFYKTMVRVFVTGWQGVTESGHEVAYSYDMLMTRLPGDTKNDLVMQLGYKIAQDTGFITGPKAEGAQETKNG